MVTANFSYGTKQSTATWKLHNTVWDSTDYVWEYYNHDQNLRKAGVDHIGLISTIGEDGEDYDNGKSSAALAAGVLSMTLLGYCVFVRPGAQKITDDFQRA